MSAGTLRARERRPRRRQGSKVGTMTQPADVPSTRYALDNATVRQKLGPLRELVRDLGRPGFNLIARPDFHDKANLYLQLNQTHETLTITPIGSAIPNRGFGQDDIELFGLSYLQKIHDHHTGGALHLEPGLWITQPCTTYPPEYPPPNGRIIARMASIPHGNAVLAQGNATSFTGAPTMPPRDWIRKYNGSVFPSFNSTPVLGRPARHQRRRLIGEARPPRRFACRLAYGPLGNMTCRLPSARTTPGPRSPPTLPSPPCRSRSGAYPCRT